MRIFILERGVQGRISYENGQGIRRTHPSSHTGKVIVKTLSEARDQGSPAANDNVRVEPRH